MSLEEFCKGKKVAVLGGHGMIGRELVNELIDLGSDVTSYDIKNGFDLSNYLECYDVCKDKDFVFSLVGVRGNPRLTREKPLDFMFPMLRCDVNIIKAAIDCNVPRFLYTSSIAVLNPETDRFPAWAKKTGETLLEAARIQYPNFKFVIVRPSNVYGRYDNFLDLNAMVVTSLIRKAIFDDVIEVWGGGEEEREFINAKDVARGMILAMKKLPELPVNLGSGQTHSIKQIAELLGRLSGKKVVYNLQEKRGDEVRVVYNDINQADIGFVARCNFENDIEEIYNYVKYSFNKVIL